MSLLHLSTAFRSHRTAATTTPGGVNGHVRVSLVRRRSIMELAGACLCIAVLAVAGTALRNDGMAADRASTTRSTLLSASSTGQIEGSSSATGANVSQDNSLASGQTDQASQTNNDSAANISISTNSSQAGDGPVTTSQVSVDGKTITAPSNTSTTHTITTPDGNQTLVTSTSLSNNQSGDDTSQHNFGSSNVHVQSFSDSYNFKEVN